MKSILHCITIPEVKFQVVLQSVSKARVEELCARRKRGSKLNQPILGIKPH